MFHFKLEPELALLTATRTGFWSLSTVAAYEITLRQELTKLHQCGASTSFIIDIRSTAAQAKDVADELRAVVSRLGSLHAERTAVIASSGLAKLQAKRVADINTQVFTSMLRARDWVLDRGDQGLNTKAVFNEPSDAEAEGHTVHIHGPSDVDVTLTPAAALETAKRIGNAAMEVLLDQASAMERKVSPA